MTSDFAIDFSAIPPSRIPFDANDPARFRERANIVIRFEAGRGFPADWMGGEISGEDEVVNAIARLELGGFSHAEIPMLPALPWFTQTYAELAVDNVSLVNYLLGRTWRHAKSGTSFHASFLDVHIDRFGDWDAVMKGLIVIMYRYRHKLGSDVYTHVLHELLNERGSRPAGADVVDDLPIALETENHVLMIESARYLTNQLLYLEGWQSGQRLDQYDNQMNGMEEWMLRHLQVFLQHDFWEFNSKPYQRYSMAALQNLYDFAWDHRVNTAARMVLDYVSAKTAVSSHGLRRAVPVRRLRELADITGLWGDKTDAQTARMTVLSGHTPRLADVSPPGHAHVYAMDQMLLAGLCTYRVPDMVLETLMNKAHPYYQQFHHGDHDNIPGGIEIYASDSTFLISAGGCGCAPETSTSTSYLITRTRRMRSRRR
jgi:hypothetical protein